MTCEFCELFKKNVEILTACEMDKNDKEFDKEVRVRMALLAEALPHVIQKVVSDMTDEEVSESQDTDGDEDATVS